MLSIAYSLGNISPNLLNDPCIRPVFYFYFIIQHVRTHAIPCPHLLPTKGDAAVLVVKVVLPPVVPPAAFATGQSMKTNR